MPALTNRRCGSAAGVGAEGTIVCPFAAKCARNLRLISAVLIVLHLLRIRCPSQYPAWPSGCWWIPAGSSRTEPCRLPPSSLAAEPVPGRISQYRQPTRRAVLGTRPSEGSQPSIWLQTVVTRTLDHARTPHRH